MIESLRGSLPAGALLCLVTSRLFAAQPVHSFECDTLPGHYSYWTQSLSTGAVEVTGTITVNELRKDKKWMPLANVMLRAGDGSINAGVSLSAMIKFPEAYLVKMSTPTGETRLGLAGVIARPKGAIPFKVVLDASGKLSVSIAGEKASAELGSFKPDTVALNCSTGDFEFKAVVVKETPR